MTRVEVAAIPTGSQALHSSDNMESWLFVGFFVHSVSRFRGAAKALFLKNIVLIICKYMKIVLISQHCPNLTVLRRRDDDV